jgi:hypothetical protein
MKNKDQILLEQAYLKIIKENEDKFQPHDPEMQELSKIGMGEEYPEEEAPESNQNDWSFVNDDLNTRHYIGYSDRTFKVRGKDVLIKTELGERTDDGHESWDFSLVDPETKEPVFKDIRQDQIEKHFGL